MDSVYLLWHSHELDDGHDEVKLIGVYRREADAQAAMERVRDKPGFRDLPEGFEIVEYPLNVDNWAEGYTTVHPRRGWNEERPALSRSSGNRRKRASGSRRP